MSPPYILFNTAQIPFGLPRSLNLSGTGSVLRTLDSPLLYVSYRVLGICTKKSSKITDILSCTTYASDFSRGKIQI